VKIERFSDLTVWQEGHKLALNVYRLTDNFPSREQFGIVAQVRRSAASVCANIAEGFGRPRREKCSDRCRSRVANWKRPGTFWFTAWQG